MARSSPWFVVVPAAACFSAPAAATTFMSVEAAQRAMFPEASSFADYGLALSPEQRKAISTASGMPTPKSQRVWQARRNNRVLGWFFLDRVLGKHELITYAVSIDATGAVRQIEILDYRETYGGEIRNPQWRGQFVGKRQGARLQLDKDIRNISGATLSCRHVTDGVKRLLATFQVVFAGR